ncbi:sugar transferase [Sphingomonas qomolangmaensis]|uniref:Sugar transferase n=1 Tax=Sphingomonas qomolangmaensis TaxID=2918765 RepID=A0ABY5L8K7_9SPHN|nr:sugar transferase [Sphingomonas qomolangmaensis]UUL82187.1 sugar transferase [Sphingomonas qomolangmaensis]
MSSSPLRKLWRPRATTLRMRMVVSLLTLDILCIVLSFLLAAWLRDLFLIASNWTSVLSVMLPIYVLAAINGHAYAASNVQDPFRAIAKGLTAFLLALSAAIFAAFTLKTTDTFPRLVVSIGSVFAVSTLAIGRYLFARHLQQIIGGNPFSVVLLRDGDAPVPTGSFSIIMATDGTFDPESHDPMMYDRLATSLAHADRVIVACDPDRRIAWAHALKGANIQGEIFVPELDALAPLGMARYGDTPTLIIATGPLGLVDRTVKRAFDIVFASIALLALAPFFVIVAILIKRDSPGPVLFTQNRIGRSNQIFRMMKFRSMRIEGCDGAGDRSTGRDDDRITKVGRFLRRTSIDELPQILNVLAGDMSIVGPRPHALGSRAADKLFWEVDRRYWHRHAAKPGLTGLAQVRGYRGATLVEADLENRLRADLEYLESWSIWRDLKIIAMTFRVLIHPNAF